MVGRAPGGGRLGPWPESFRFDDRQDFEDADRGLIDKLDPGVITDADGQVVWDNDAYGFLEA